MSLTYSGNKFYYIKNIQDHIIGILNSNLEQIVKYEYDSWGNIMSITDNNGKDFSNYRTEDLYFKSGDLGLAVGKANATISGTKNQNNSWNISIKIFDEYDFDGQRELTSTSNILNNIGDIMENMGLLHPYKWDVTYKFTYYGE